LSLQQLRCFREVCRLGGYAPAARKLSLTGPAVWEQMKTLERYYATALVQRTGRRICATAQGERLLELIRPLLAGLESTRSVLQQEDEILPCHMTIVSHLRALEEEISAAIGCFRRRYPGVRLKFHAADSKDMQPLVQDGTADVALMLERGPDEPVSHAITVEPAGELDFLLVAPPDHELVRRSAFRLKSIVKYPLVLTDAETCTRRRVEEVFHRYNMSGEMEVSAEVRSGECIPACVRAGLGLGIVVGNPRSPLYQGTRVRSLRRWFGTARLCFLWRRGAHVTPLQRELADLLHFSIAQPAHRGNGSRSATNGR
jgi:DNA-binding transcriptional LysR family regulator